MKLSRQPKLEGGGASERSGSREPKLVGGGASDRSGSRLRGRLGRLLLVVGLLLAGIPLSCSMLRPETGPRPVGSGTAGPPHLQHASTATPPDPRREPPAPLGILSAERVETDADEALWSVTLADEQGRSLSTYLRRPSEPGPHPLVVLIAGRYAGREAALLIPKPLRFVVLAVEYPADIPRRFSARDALLGLREMRSTAMEMPDLLVRAAAHVAKDPVVDARRVGLVGVSFGVPFATLAGKDPTFQAVVLAFGGAGIAEMLDGLLPIRWNPARSASAMLAAHFLRDLEPARHVGDIPATSLLLINGAFDELIPETAAARLAGAAQHPVNHIWLPTGHLRSSSHGVIEQLVELSLDFFETAWRTEE